MSDTLRNALRDLLEYCAERDPGQGDPERDDPRITAAGAALASQPVQAEAPGEIADAARVIAWAREVPRRPANSAFTAGAERQAAYWIEWAQSAMQADAPDTRKPCTCDGAGRGPGRPCVVKAGGRLGELWRCCNGLESAPAAEAVQPVQAEAPEPAWCAANGSQPCRIGPHGPKGALQCEWCGDSPAPAADAVQREPVTLADVLDALNRFNRPKPNEDGGPWEGGHYIRVDHLPDFINVIAAAWFAAPAVKAEAAQRSSPGIPDKSPALAVRLTADELADKCEAWLQGEGRDVGNVVDAYEAGYREAEAANGLRGE